MESTGNIENLGMKVVFRRKLCGKTCYAMNNFGMFFSLHVVFKYILKAITLIRTAFIHKIVMFYNISIRQINNIPLILYFSHIFTLKPVAEIISRTMFLEK